MRYQTIVFDLDGTLVDTVPDIATSFNKVLKQEGYPAHPTDAYRNFVGWGLSRTLEMALPEAVGGGDFGRLLTMVQQAYIADPMSRSRLYPGIKELIEYLLTRKLKIVVFTNKDQNIASAIVSGLLEGYPIDRVIGRSDEYPPKPNPDVLMAYMAESRSSFILMVGDSTVDVKTASNAHVDFVGAGWGYSSVEDLELAGSRRNFAAPADLYRYLLKKEVIYDK